jgi:hypothetical protein
MGDAQTCTRFSAYDANDFCTKFNTYKDPRSQYPATCTVGEAKQTTKDLLNLISNIGSLKKQAALLSRSSSVDSTSAGQLRDTINQFCCTYAAKQRLQTDLHSATEAYNVAKDRAKSVQKPTRDVSPYGTYVPFGRSLRTDSAPILLVFILVFLIFSIGLLLNLGSIQLSYKSPGPGFFSYLINEITTAFQATSFMVLVPTILVSVGATAGIYYAITKQKS